MSFPGCRVGSPPVAHGDSRANDSAGRLAHGGGRGAAPSPTNRRRRAATLALTRGGPAGAGGATGAHYNEPANRFMRRASGSRRARRFYAWGVSAATAAVKASMMRSARHPSCVAFSNRAMSS